MRSEMYSRRVLCLSIASCISCLAFPLHAQTYPAKAVRLVVGFPAGGPTDIVSRTIAPKMSEALGQTVLVDNRGRLTATRYSWAR